MDEDLYKKFGLDKMPPLTEIGIYVNGNEVVVDDPHAILESFDSSDLKEYEFSPLQKAAVIAIGLAYNRALDIRQAFVLWNTLSRAAFEL